MDKERQEPVEIVSARMHDMKYEVMISASYEEKKSRIFSRAWRGIFGFEYWSIGWINPQGFVGIWIIIPRRPN